MVPDAVRGKPADVLAILLYGQELGLGPMQSLQSIYVVKGRPSLSSQLWRALALRAGHKVFSESEHNKSATFTVLRHDDPEPHTVQYTLEDAIQAGRVSLKDGKPYSRSQKGEPLPWETTTDDMLLARATSRALRFKCPEVALGFYALDEIEDSAPPDDVAVAEVVGPAPIADEDAAAAVAELAAEFKDWPEVTPPGGADA
jgi:hypothetical protein